jgi:hypothetical protein
MLSANVLGAVVVSGDRRRAIHGHCLLPSEIISNETTHQITMLTYLRDSTNPPQFASAQRMTYRTCNSRAGGMGEKEESDDMAARSTSRLLSGAVT